MSGRAAGVNHFYEGAKEAEAFSLEDVSVDAVSVTTVFAGGVSSEAVLAVAKLAAGVSVSAVVVVAVLAVAVSIEAVLAKAWLVHSNSDSGASDNGELGNSELDFVGPLAPTTLDLVVSLGAGSEASDAMRADSE